MKTTISLAVAGAATLLSGCMMEEEPGISAEAQSRLAVELEGYAPDGPAVSCVRSPDLEGNRTVGPDTIVFSGPGGRKWVNHTRGGCPSLEFGRALRFRTTSPQLCSGDIAVVFEPTTGIEYGGCALGDFTPYRRAR
ncbi:MAG TPA: hypothetical protein VFO69_00230 [Allosphingosinicella sp.]|nr:hypothetical protein [Allosphingosinicella sp.]